MSNRSLALPIALLALLAAPAAGRAERLVGHDAYARAQAGAERRPGGFFKYGFHIAKGGILYGVLAGAAGYFIAGPSAALEWAGKGATGGMVWRSATGGSKSGVFKRSARSFAKADLAEVKGQPIRKHYHKLKGVVWSAVESGVVGGAASGTLGLFLGGPANAIPSAITGGLLGSAFGAATGVAKAYVVPFFKRRSLDWSLSRAASALAHLERDPANPAWRDEVAKRLAQVHAKKENLPRLSEGQSQRYVELGARAARLASGRPALASLASALY
jgi:hypothetical protein